MSRIVVGVDGSENSVAAAAWAVEQARLRGAGLDVVVAWEFPPPVEFTVPTEAELAHEAESVLAGVLSQLSTDGVTVNGSTKLGAPARVLLDAATDADMLVIGSRGHGTFVGLLLGSVSMRVVTHATVPTVVVPPPSR